MVIGGLVIGMAVPGYSTTVVKPYFATVDSTKLILVAPASSSNLGSKSALLKIAIQQSDKCTSLSAQYEVKSILSRPTAVKVPIIFEPNQNSAVATKYASEPKYTGFYVINGTQNTQVWTYSPQSGVNDLPSYRWIIRTVENKKTYTYTSPWLSYDKNYKSAMVVIPTLESLKSGYKFVKTEGS